MDKEQLDLLKKIMATEFCGIELTLYLDTHPEDRKALDDYNQVVKALNNLVARYTERYGPLCVNGYFGSELPWEWIESPWPWEINYNDVD